jgi:L-gulonate 3-dehydrogenase
MSQWGAQQTPEHVKKLSDWRDGRLAALQVHKRAAARKPR